MLNTHVRTYAGRIITVGKVFDQRHGNRTLRFMRQSVGFSGREGEWSSRESRLKSAIYVSFGWGEAVFGADGFR